MRAVVKVILSQESSPSDAARYIAESAIDPEREGEKSRPLFTNREDDDLGYRKANTFLTGGKGTPLEKDLIHIPVSFEPADFEALGATDEERKERLREVAREAMEEVKGDLRDTHYKLRNYRHRKHPNSQLDWRWVAGIHLNTDNPHIHFLIHKDMVDGRGKTVRVGRIPKELLPHVERIPDGGARPVEGVIGDRFVASLERVQDRAREALLEREVLNMGLPVLSSDFKDFERPLSFQGVEYNNMENFVAAMKAEGVEERRVIASLPPEKAKQVGALLDRLRQLQSDEARRAQLKETRDKIAEAFPDEARALGERINARPDWMNVRLEVFEAGIRHRFAPGTRAHAQLLFTGDRELNNGTERNFLGELLMDIREEGKYRRAKNDSDRPDRLHSDEKLLELAERNPSTGGRELVQELILRGHAPEPVSPPDALGDIREALKDRRMDDPYYDSQPGRADWLGGHSQELRDLYERGAVIKDNVLVIPAEGHELNGLTSDRDPFLNELRYAHRTIPDPEKANEFYSLAKTIAGKTADKDAEVEYFRYFYNRIGHDADGRRLGYKQKEEREEALERTLAEMRLLAGEMEKLETLVSVEARGGAELTLVRVEALRNNEAGFGADPYDEGPERRNGGDFALDEWEESLSDSGGITEFVDAVEYGEPEESEPEGAGEEVTPGSKREDQHEIGSFVFNTAARNFNLRDESLRFPAELTFEDRKALVEVHLPNIDAKIESGRPREAIIGDINQMTLDWNLNLSEEGAARQKLANQNDRTGSFLKAYTNERLKDPETRALNRSDAFRDAHERITEARAPAEINRAALAVLEGKNLNWRERALLFFGRSPAHHTPEMRELRHSWGLTWAGRAEYAKSLGEGRRSPSPALEKMLAELETRRTARAIRHYRASIINEKMEKPGEIDLRAMYERLRSFERDYLFAKIEERVEALGARDSSLRETAYRIDEPPLPPVRASRENEALRIYLAGVKDVEQSLVKDQPLSQTERARIHERACRMAWDRLVLPETLADSPTGAARLLSDTIAELQEKVQPRARLAAQALDEFVREKTGEDHTSGRIPREASSKLDTREQERLGELRRYAAETREELFEGFEKIDGLRQEIVAAREGKEVEKTSSIAIEAGVRAADAGRPNPGPDLAPAESAGRSTLDSAPRVDSYREYMGYVAEIEGRLISEADRGLTREDRLRIRAAASGLAWERLEPQRILTNDPAVMELLSLGEAVTRLRDEIRPQAREAARRLDEFIRSRGLDRFAERKTDYYYRGDQIPGGELEKLAPADQRAFAALEAHAGATLAQFKDGFLTVDRIRQGIAQIGKAPGGAGSQAPAQDTEPADGVIKHNPLPERGENADRRLLGRAIIAEALADCAALDYERARDYGHTFRFDVRDESVGANRRISGLDIQRRAAARGARAADEAAAGRRDDRLAISGQVSEADLRYHSTTLDEHDKRLTKLLAELESQAREAAVAYRHSRQLAGEVMEQYQSRGEPLPPPLVERETLVKAQDEAVKRGLAGHTEKLERMRAAHAEEQGEPARLDQEAARLAAQVFTANTELMAREERARRFEESRHLRQWEIGGEKFSLADIDRRIEERADEAKVLGRYELHLDSESRRQAGAEIESLGEVRREVVEKTAERQGRMRDEAREARGLFETLARAYAHEHALREQKGEPAPAPRFTREELDRAADNIETVRDAGLLRELSVFERRFNTYADREEKFRPAEGWGRAPTRAVMAEIFHRESGEALAAFERRGEVQPLLIETPSGGLLTRSVRDTMPKSILEGIARPLMETEERRELRQAVDTAYSAYEGRLAEDFKRAGSYLEAAREIASAQAAERNARAGHELPAPEPALTPKQANTIEIYAERQTDPGERERLLSLARGEGSDRRDLQPSIDSSTHSPEPPPPREFESSPGRPR